MTTKSASATLTSSFTFRPITGFINYNQGTIDSATGYIKAVGSGRWGDLVGKKWSDFKSYITNYLPIIWSTPRIDTGEINWFTLAINSEFLGNLYYRIHVSNTGDFIGEETEYLIIDGQTNISAFYGRYVYVTGFCSGRQLQRMTTTTSRELLEFKFRDVDTSTLAGSATERVFPLTNPISKVTEFTVTPRATTATNYAVDLYVSDTATSSILIPMNIRKDNQGDYFIADYIETDYFLAGTSVSFALFGIDNQARDGIVDISIKGLPRQVMASGNLYVIT
jgi:hypothetical protein